MNCAVTLALLGKSSLPFQENSEGSCTQSINHFHPLLYSMFLNVDGVERVEGSRVQRTRTGLARINNMAAHIYDCFGARELRAGDETA